MAKWTEEETSFLEVLNKNDLIGKDIVEAFKLKFKSNRSNASIIAKNNKIKNEISFKNEDKEIEKKEILEELPEEIILKQNEEIEVVDMVKNVKEKNIDNDFEPNHIGVIGLVVSLLILVYLGCSISPSFYFGSMIGYFIANTFFNRLDNQGEPSFFSVALPFIPVLNILIGIFIMFDFIEGRNKPFISNKIKKNV